MASKQVAVAVAVLLLLPVRVLAEQPASAPTTQSARQLLKQGKKQFAEGKYAEALVSLEGALAQEKTPETILLVAHCQRELGQDDKALEQYGVYLAEWEAQHPGKPSPHVAEIDGHIAALRERIAEREAKKAAARQREEEQEARRERAAAKKRQQEQQRRKAREAKQLQQRLEVVERKRRALRIIAVSGAALAATGVFAGGAFYGASDSAQHGESFTSARQLSVTSFVLAGLGGAAAATCGLWYVLTRPREKPSVPAVTAAVAPTAGGAAVSATLRF